MKKFRKPLLVAHVIASVGLLGATSSSLLLALVADGDRDVYELISLQSAVFGIPLSFIALFTGIALGLATKWGVLRYWWTTLKLGLLVGVILNGALMIGPTTAQLADGDGLQRAADLRREPERDDARAVGRAVGLQARRARQEALGERRRERDHALDHAVAPDLDREPARGVDVPLPDNRLRRAELRVRRLRQDRRPVLDADDDVPAEPHIDARRCGGRRRVVAEHARGAAEAPAVVARRGSQLAIGVRAGEAFRQPVPAPQVARGSCSGS